jgi:DUF4097 and DUF4098 domain-containing protein YvlB
MTSKSKGVLFRLFSLLWLSVSVGLPLAASEQVYLKPGTPQRQGRAWVKDTDCSMPAREGGRMVLRADLGAVKVRTGVADRVNGRVRVSAYTADENEADRLFRRYELKVRRLKAGGILVESGIASRDRASVRLRIEFEFEVPRRFNLDLETQEGDIEVERLDGQLRTSTAAGNIRSGDIDGPAKVETAGGSITLGNIGGRLDAQTAGGNIQVGDVKGNAILETSGGGINAGRVGGTVLAETVGGDIALRGASGALRAETAGGQIWIGESDGSISAQSAGGTIRLEGGRGTVTASTGGGNIDLFQVQGAVHAETSLGSILAQIGAGRDTFGPSTLETSLGDVQVYLPPDFPLTIDAAIELASGHKIESDFPLRIAGEAPGYVAQTLRGSGNLNGGGKLLYIRTVAGNIEIRKLDTATLEKLKQQQDAPSSHRRQIKHAPERREREHDQD